MESVQIFAFPPRWVAGNPVGMLPAPLGVGTAGLDAVALFAQGNRRWMEKPFPAPTGRRLPAKGATLERAGNGDAF